MWPTDSNQILLLIHFYPKHIGKTSLFSPSVFKTNHDLLV